MMRSFKKQLMFVPLLCSLLLLTGCSYITDFAVINESDQPLEVRYKIKNYPGSFSPPVTPATIAASQLSTIGNQQWNNLGGRGNRGQACDLCDSQSPPLPVFFDNEGSEANEDPKSQKSQA